MQGLKIIFALLALIANITAFYPYLRDIFLKKQNHIFIHGLFGRSLKGRQFLLFGMVVEVGVPLN
ncbi:MAG: hypothetical protein WCX46_01600 [Candidatus Paceibacterota bacterium]